MKLKNIENKVKDSANITKEFFTIDIDTLYYPKIVYSYAYGLAIFFEDSKDIQEELENPKKIRIHYSSSKKGVHIKVREKHTIIESLYLRSLLGDDAYRIKNDLIRLNNDYICYDVVFSSKIKNNKLQIKDYSLINDKIIKSIGYYDLHRLINAIRNNEVNIIKEIMESMAQEYSLKNMIDCIY